MKAYLLGKCTSADFVKRDDGHSLPELTVLQEILANLLVLHDNIIQPPTCSNLQCCGLVEILSVEGDQRGNGTFNL